MKMCWINKWIGYDNCVSQLINLQSKNHYILLLAEKKLCIKFFKDILKSWCL